MVQAQVLDLLTEAGPRARRRAGDDQPRPVRARDDVRPASRSCTPAGSSRKGPAGQVFDDTEPPVQQGAGRRVPDDRRPGLAASRPRGLPGRPAVPRRPADRLPVPPALPRRHRPVRRSTRGPSWSPAGGLAATAACHAWWGRDATMAPDAGDDRQAAVLEVHDLEVTFRGRGRRPAHAVDGVDLAIAPGEIVALAGESAAARPRWPGRSSVSSGPPRGEVVHGPAAGLQRPALQAYRRQVQLVLQDPTGSLNPRHTVYEAVAEGLRIHKVRGNEAQLVARGALAGRAAAAGAVLPALPARAVRRPAPARRDRRGAGARTRGDRRRRAGVLARRLGARRDPGAAAQAARRPRA